jgi:hypothetical protein
VIDLGQELLGLTTTTTLPAAGPLHAASVAAAAAHARYGLVPTVSGNTVRSFSKSWEKVTSPKEL